MTTAFDVFRDYVALKSHFRTSYDYFKFNGKISAKPSALERRKDKYFFSKLAKNPEYQNVLLANFVENDSAWIGDLVESDAKELYTRWKKKIESLTYLYKSDLGALDLDFNSNFVSEDGQHPKLLTLHLQRDVSLETMVILDKLVHYRKRWDNAISEKYVWPDISLKIKKYGPFINIDRDKMRQITAETFS